TSPSGAASTRSTRPGSATPPPANRACSGPAGPPASPSMPRVRRGPGWPTAAPTIAVTDPDGATVTFAKTTSGFAPTGDDASSGLTLTAGSTASYGPASWTVADL